MTAGDVPPEAAAWIGRVMVVERDGVTVEPGSIALFAAAVEDGNPLYRDTAEAAALAGGPMAPPALLSAWNRPDPWMAGGAPPSRALELHFRVKEALGLPKAVVTRAETELHAPVRPGDHVYAEQRLDTIGPMTANKLGTGRYWTISVLYRRQADDALLGIETLGFYGYGGAA
ncbi:FAS1-like dehydratase domain-containing protein [Sphingobium estronivorans]|uniref:FAS1-like dehydratase domain-containing protein n=1 Tax=Sphingobium estronivorans TaxID=1577690 RepID=UPI0013C353E5|nr:MaoC family dehydratase N-terminal domain-containing protein [Sphingobium estronivorans]